MQTSDKLDKLLPALLKAQGQLEHAKKTSENPHFKSKYADLAEVLDTVKPALQQHGLVVTHARHISANTNTENGQHITTFNEYLTTTIFHAESGQFISSTTLLQPVKKDPQGYGSAITYARRYDLSALIGLAQDDDDGNSASQGKPEKANAKAIYGTHTAMKKKWDEIVDEINGAPTHEALKEVWKRNNNHILAMKSMELGEDLYAQLESIKNDRKEKITEEEANQAAYGRK